MGLGLVEHNVFLRLLAMHHVARAQPARGRAAWVDALGMPALVGISLNLPFAFLGIELFLQRPVGRLPWAV